MKTTFSTSAQNDEVTLGWTAMPAFGSRLNQKNDAVTVADFVACAVKSPGADAFSNFWSALTAGTTAKRTPAVA